MGKEKKERISERGGRKISSVIDRIRDWIHLRNTEAILREARARREMQDLRREESSKDSDLYSRLYFRQWGDY